MRPPSASSTAAASIAVSGCAEALPVIAARVVCASDGLAGQPGRARWSWSRTACGRARDRASNGLSGSGVEVAAHSATPPGGVASHSATDRGHRCARRPCQDIPVVALGGRHRQFSRPPPISTSETAGERGLHLLPGDVDAASRACVLAGVAVLFPGAFRRMGGGGGQRGMGDARGGDHARSLRGELPQGELRRDERAGAVPLRAWPAITPIQVFANWRSRSWCRPVRGHGRCCRSLLSAGGLR